MGSERGQATVEGVGLVVAVGLLLGALVAALGASGLAAALAAAVADGLSSAVPGAPAPQPARAVPSVADASLFASATDRTVPLDRRRTLRDVRLTLGEWHGAAAGDAVFDALVRDYARATVERLRTPREYRDSPAGATAATQLLAPPAGRALRQLEEPIGPPSAPRLVTASEAERALVSRIQAGTSWIDVALSIAGAVPGEGLVATAIRTASNVAQAIESVDGVTPPDEGAEDGVPPAEREDDLVVIWPVRRRMVTPTGRPATALPAIKGPRTYRHVAVVRDGAVIAQALLPLGGTQHTSAAG